MRALRLLVLLIAIAITIPFIPASVRGMTGSGTAEDPYLVYNQSDLEDIADHIDAYYELANDITLTGTWVPLCEYLGPADYEFTGYFDGNNHTISGLSISRDGTTGVESAGLFAAAGDGAVFKDVVISGATVEAVDMDYTGVGILLGYGWGCTITNVDVSGTITVYEDSYSETGVPVGGLVGGLDAIDVVALDNNVSSCTADVAIEVTNYDSDVGGLVGLTGYDGFDYETYISNSNCTGMITTTLGDSAGYTGGFIGTAYRAFIDQCYSTSDLVIGAQTVGGFSGYIRDGTIDECYYEGSLTGDSVGYASGFLYGYEYTGVESVSNCYTICTVTMPNLYEFAGFSDTAGEPIFTNCYSCCDTTLAVADYVSGFDWIETTGDDCIWNSDLLTPVNTDDLAPDTGAQSCTTVEMKTQSTYTNEGWDFVNTWKITACNDGYPCLANTTPSCSLGEPQSPTDLVISSITPNSIILTWTAGANTTKTLIRRKTTAFVGSASEVTEGTLVYFNTGTTFTDTGLELGETYYYRAWGWNNG